MTTRRVLSIPKLYEDHAEKLQLTWVIAVGVARKIEFRDAEIFGPDVVGHLNLIHPARIQVFGQEEMDYYQRFDSKRRAHLPMHATV